MVVTCTRKATTLPFELAMLKQHCRVDSDYTDDDGILEMYAWAAIRQGEFETNRVWVQSQWRLDSGAPISVAVEIPKSPATALTSVVSIDRQGAEHPVSVDGYRFMPSALDWDGGMPFAVVSPVGGWPEHRSLRFGFDAGWPGEAFPEELVQWLFVKVAGKYEQREDIASASRKLAVPFPRHFADSLLDHYYLPRW